MYIGGLPILFNIFRLRVTSYTHKGELVMIEGQCNTLQDMKCNKAYKAEIVTRFLLI